MQFSPTMRGVMGWLAVVVVLAIPSLYLLLNEPVWWRDSDGLLQVTKRPSHLVVVHWPPLYCFAARLPLWIGGFNDASFQVLILSQHVLLVAAEAWLVGVMASRWAIRIGAAIFLAACPIAPSFAQCVGSETLSLIAVYAVAAAALWAVKTEAERRGTSRVVEIARRYAPWLALTLALYVCLQSRHVNILYAGILPVVGLLLGTWFWRDAFQRARWLRMAGLSLMAGVVASAGSWLTVRLICLKHRIEPVSSLGYTFQWRLQEIHRQLPGESRAFAARISEKLPQDDHVSRKVLSLWADKEIVTKTDFMARQFDALLRAQGVEGAHYESKRRLNTIAKAVLIPPDPIYLRTVRRDFLGGLTWSVGLIALEPPTCTAVVFDWLRGDGGVQRLETVAPLAELSTFKDHTKDEVLAMRRNPWIGLWENVSLRMWIGLAAILLGAALLVRVRDPEAGAVWLVGLGLFSVGLAIWLANCMFTFHGERFGLQLWQNTQIAILVSGAMLARHR